MEDVLVTINVSELEKDFYKALEEAKCSSIFRSTEKDNTVQDLLKLLKMIKKYDIKKKV